MIETLSPTRRQLLRASVTGGCGLSLAGLWRAQALAETNGAAAKIRACVVVFYYGGPSHVDTFDLKPNAPADVRGEFQPIASSAPGVMVSEHLPRMAKVMHKVAVVRSVNHQNRLHDSASTEMLTGRQSPQGDREEFAPIPQFYPCVGAPAVICGKRVGWMCRMRRCRSCFTMSSMCRAKEAASSVRPLTRCRSLWMSRSVRIEPAR